MQSPKWMQIGKIIVSFATFCFVFPHALNDYGNAKEEAERKAKPTDV